MKVPGSDGVAVRAGIVDLEMKPGLKMP